MVDDYMLDNVLAKITEIIGIEKFDDTMTLIDTEYKLLHEITLKNVVIVMTCVTKMMIVDISTSIFRSIIIRSIKDSIDTF